MALLLSLPSPPAIADSSLELTRVEHLQSLLIEHDVRYVVQTEQTLSGYCLPDAAEGER
jgi:hypothetical protein